MDDLKQIIQQEYIRCATDPVHFFQKYCYIQHPIKGRISFQLYPFQENVLKAFRDNNFNIINKSRQLGISTLCAGYALWIMLFQRDKAILCIATKQLTAQNMIEKVKFMYKNLPSWLKGNKKPLIENLTELKLPNGSFIKATSASGDSGRSFAISWLIIDEAAFIDGIDTLYTGLLPTLATGGGGVVLSSPNGVGNWFHRMWIKSLEGKSNYNAIQLKWDLHPDRDEKWLEEEKTKFTPREFAQEYNCDFLGSGASVIDPSILNRYEKDFIKEPIEKRGIGNDYWIWEYPDYSKEYMVCADVARGDSSDFSTFHVIEVESCTQVAEFKSQLPTRDFGHVLASVGQEYNKALIIVENANIGWDVVNTLLEINYSNLYYSPRSYGDMSVDNYLNKLDSDQTVPGFTMSNRTRPLVIAKLESYIREGSFIIQSRRLIDELRVFIWKDGKPQAQNGYNDDLVISAGIGMYIRDTALKYMQLNKEIQEASLQGMRKTNALFYGARDFNYINSTNPYKTWTMPGYNQGKSEDLKWLLK